jgi:hypothetical protein
MIENPSLPGSRRLCPFSRMIITRSSDQCLLLLFTLELFLFEKPALYSLQALPSLTNKSFPR